MKNKALLQICRDLWREKEDFRTARKRHKRYTYGDQWSDIIRTPEGKYMVEGEYLSMTGSKPYTNNLIRQLVKSIVGRYRTASREDGRYGANATDESFAVRNALGELDSRMLEEFLISGAAVQRLDFDRRDPGVGSRSGREEEAGTEKWVDNVDPRLFFCDGGMDPRGHDITVAGMIHDLPFGEIARRFGRGSGRRIRALRDCFGIGHGATLFGGASDFTMCVTDPFLTSGKEGMCRVTEVWSLDCRRCPTQEKEVMTADEGRDGRERDRAVLVEKCWRCRWLAPDGEIVAEYDSPYGHGSHPFVMKFYPLIDGEIHSFVEDVIDQQRFINRLIVMMDRMLASSAKGVLLFPLDQLAPGVTFESVAEAWSKCNSIIPVTGRGVEMPRQIVNSGEHDGAYRLLEMQMKMLDSISGVSDALMGRNVNANTGAAMYEAQIKNSTVSIADLLDSFGAFIEARDRKASLM